MSLLDQASLVLVPSAIKTGEVLVQKPLPTKFSDETGNYDGNDPQGSANLTFTRNSNATRVNADGLVEKVRTNELVYSQDFTQTAWTSFSTATLSSTTTVTPAGTTDAVRLTATGAVQDLRTVRTITNGVTYTNSAYVRRVSGTGIINILDVNGTTSNIAVTSEWQRFSVTSTATSTTGRLYIRIQTSGDVIEVWGCQMEASDFGPTQYIPTTSAAVSVGPTANVPRLDYSGGCSRLILEPQRTNLLYSSEALTSTDWTKYGGQTITGNDAISPDGYQNADKMVDAGGVFQQRAFSPSTAYALSVFIKKDTATSFRLGFVDYQSGGYFGGDIRYTFATGAITVTQSLNSSVSGEAVDYGNGWIRLICKFTTNASQNYNYQFAEYDGGTGWSWGYQLEAGSYATSLISTQSASVTRLADSASRTNIANLIGQTEGTLFAEFEIDADNTNGYNRVLAVSDGTANNRIFIFAQNTEVFRFYVANGGAAQVDIVSSTSILGGRHKVAFAYKANDFIAYVDGVQVGSDTSGTVPACPNVYVGTSESGSTQPLEGGINQALLFKTRLPNATLANLTAL